MCANYNYDTWLTAFTMYGIACILSEIQQPEKKISRNEVIAMLGAFILGCAAKAIYFPLILSAFFIKKDKFNNIKQLKIFRASVAFTLIFIVFSFVFPMFMSQSASLSDVRGGDGVNGTEQIKYILTNLPQYIKNLIVFLSSYLSASGSQGYMTFLAYLGHGGFHGLLLIILAVVCVIDKNNYDKYTSTIVFKAYNIIVYIITSALIATSLYITFTPVASSTINGCQPRYLIPLLFPVLTVIGSSNITNNIRKNIYYLFVFGIMLFINVYIFCDLVINKLYI